MAVGHGGLFYALLPLIGIVTILGSRFRRKSGRAEPEEAGLAARHAATLETERRMTAYLAQRSAEEYQAERDDSLQEQSR